MMPISPVVLTIKGLGHVPSFKNKKRICGQQLITNRVVKRWMEACISSFVSQLKSVAQTAGDATSTGWQRRYWTVSLLPWDDSRQWITKLIVEAKEVDKGNEGATLTITRI